MKRGKDKKRVFKPKKLRETAYAACLPAAYPFTLVQEPGMPIKVIGGLSGANPSLVYTATINEKGALGDCSVEVQGNEFNPLVKFDKNGELKEGQDPELGRLILPLPDEFGEIYLDEVILEQNLTGRKGIIGRSITVSTGGSRIACCAIEAIEPVDCVCTKLSTKECCLAQCEEFPEKSWCEFAPEP